MTDLSSFTADQLAEKVKTGWRYEGGLHPDTLPFLAELQTRANLHDEAIRRMVTLRAKVEATNNALTGCIESLKAAEKERGGALASYEAACQEADRLEKERDEARSEGKKWLTKMTVRASEAEARLAETQKALRPFKTCAEAFDGAAALTDTEFGRLRARLWPVILDARAALATTTTEDKT